jgi:DNA repair exonuclease SbcCD ATPase subunit
MKATIPVGGLGLALLATLFFSPPAVQAQAPPADKAQVEELQKAKAQYETELKALKAALEKERLALQAQRDELEKQRQDSRKALEEAQRAQAEALRAAEERRAALRGAAEAAARGPQPADVDPAFQQLQAKRQKILEGFNRELALLKEREAELQARMRKELAEVDATQAAVKERLRDQQLPRAGSVEQKLDRILERLDQLEKRMGEIEKGKPAPGLQRGRQKIPRDFF